MKKYYISPSLRSIGLENEEFIAHSIELDGTLPGGTEIGTGPHVEEGEEVEGDVKRNLWDELW